MSSARSVTESGAFFRLCFSFLQFLQTFARGSFLVMELRLLLIRYQSTYIKKKSQNGQGEKKKKKKKLKLLLSSVRLRRDFLASDPCCKGPFASSCSKKSASESDCRCMGWLKTCKVTSAATVCFHYLHHHHHHHHRYCYSVKSVITNNV